jgi:hypothetical protein
LEVYPFSFQGASLAFQGVQKEVQDEEGKEMEDHQIFYQDDQNHFENPFDQHHAKT